jgi:pimeloyl-ACP methyl ester carboxylesterase
MDARFAAMRRGGGAEAAKVAAQSVFSDAWRESHPDELAGFLEWRTQHDQAALIEVMRAVSYFDVSAQLPGLLVPTMVVTATGDKMMPPEAQAPIAKLIPGAEHIEIEDSGHMVSIEQPEVFDSVLDEFLESRWRP